jgi:hypothetical protein
MPSDELDLFKELEDFSAVFPRQWNIMRAPRKGADTI